VSRLDSFIRRLEAQRACLDLAAALVRQLDGVILELGLGNGRTYDHLRELCPGRKIYVCERLVALRIPKEQFMRMVREFPNIAISIMRELAHRVDTTNNQLRQAKADLERLGGAVAAL